MTAIPSLKRILFCLLASLLAPAAALGHGESEPGPNGGEIRMPGAFHVEAIAGEDVLRVYLLDMQFNDPRVADSSVDATLVQEGNELALECRPSNEKKMFECPLPAEAHLQTGELTIDASRAGTPGATARYELPLLQADDQGEDQGDA